MSQHLQREIARLKKLILSLTAIVEDRVRHAVKSVKERNEEMAQRVISGDIEIDQREVDIEEECLKLLALYQPVAADLRFIIAVLKINNDLERISDLAVNIAERAVFLARQPKIDVPFDFPLMAEKAQTMLRMSLDALVNWQSSMAMEVCAMDDEVDAINREMYNQIKDEIRLHPENLDSLIHLLSVSRHLERIADHATNVSEDVIYMIEGKIIRHRTEDFAAGSN
ncbi:MAG TPA: phosphate signaling complex protein PhoU [bacterium]|nr:phosphate signaling complex protein PhoU [bacterium]